MITFSIDGVSTVGKVWPGFVGQILEMWLVRVREPPALRLTLDRYAMNLLQKYNVRASFCNTLAHRIEHKPAIATAVTLVDVVRQYMNFML